MKLTKDDLIQAYSDGRDRGQAEGRAARNQLDIERMSLKMRIAELEAQLKDLSGAIAVILENASAYQSSLPFSPPSGGGGADGVKSEPASAHGPAARPGAVEEVPWADAKS